MEQKITGYHKDEENDWVAELHCGHFQHVRHNPPWTNRPWVVTQAGRNEMLGCILKCKKCDEGSPPDQATHLEQDAAKASRADFDRVMQAVPDVEPDEYDRL